VSKVVTEEVQMSLTQYTRHMDIRQRVNILNAEGYSNKLRGL
jgi:hypothetical protein